MEQKIAELTEERDGVLDVARRLNSKRYYDRAIGLTERLDDLARLQSVSKSPD